MFVLTFEAGYAEWLNGWLNNRVQALFKSVDEMYLKNNKGAVVRK